MLLVGFLKGAEEANEEITAENRLGGVNEDADGEQRSEILDRSVTLQVSTDLHEAFGP